MARRAQSKRHTTFWVTCVLAVIVTVPWLLPGCSFEPSALKGHGVLQKPHVEDDQDGGE